MDHTTSQRSAEASSSGRASVNGVELAWTERGTGPVLVLVHGYTGCQADWDPVVGALAAHRRVLTFDHRGHGDSANTGDESSYTLAQLDADLEALLDELMIERFDLLGHSMGGAVAMRYVLAHPHRVRSLVLMDTSARPFFGDGDGVPDFMRMGLDLARSSGMQAVLDLMAPLMGTGAEAEVALARLRDSYVRMDPLAFAALGEQLFVAEDLLDRLRSVTAPTLVLVGEHDVGLRPAADELAATIPGARHVVVAGAAHSPQLEATGAWLTAVEGFLVEVDARN